MHRLKTVMGDLYLVAQNVEHHRQALRRVLVIVHNQDTPPGETDGVHVVRRDRLRGFQPGGPGQAHHELAPLTRSRTLGFNAASVHLDQPLHQHQPDAEPALCAIQGEIDLHKHIKDSRQHLPGNAGAVIPDANSDPFVVAPGRHPDVPARTGVLGGIVQQVGEDLSQPRRVSDQPEGVVGQSRC